MARGRLVPGVHVFGVQHHSPRSSLVLERFLDETRPACVLVEGPSDAAAALPALADTRTVPPVALVAVRADGPPGASVWPFVDWSPEHVALRWAGRHGAETGFVDILAGVSLALDPVPPPSEADAYRPGWPRRRSGRDLGARIAEVRGLRSFDEYWETDFELPGHDPTSFQAALGAYARLVRELHDHPLDRAREAWMADRIAEAARRFPPERIVVVLGAAHVLALQRGVGRAPGDLPEPVPARFCLTPYSLARLGEQAGHGAGCRAPAFYQRAWEARGDYGRASAETLVALTDALREEGHAVSQGDGVEAWRLALSLASLRGKHAPGLDEVRDAAVAVLLGGDDAELDQVGGRVFTGALVGRAGPLPEGVCASPLAVELRARLGQLGLTPGEEPRTLHLDLGEPTHRRISVVLHGARCLGVPGAELVRYSGSGSGREDRRARARAEPLRVEECWRLGWNRETETVLEQAASLGATVEAASACRLADRLAGARTTGQAAEVLVDGVLQASVDVVSQALAACERLLAEDDGLTSLALALERVCGLVRVTEPLCNPQAVGDLVERIATCLFGVVPRVLGAGLGATEPELSALRVVHGVALRDRRVDAEAWARTAGRLVGDPGVDPAAAGVLCGLLYLGRQMDEAVMVEHLCARLAAGGPPAARFLSGLLSTNARVLVRDVAFVSALDHLVESAAPSTVLSLAVVLRSALAQRGASAARLLMESVAMRRGLVGRTRSTDALRAEVDAGRLSDLDESLHSHLDELDDLL